MFYQLYTVHASIHGKVIPLVYALLTGKTADLYKRFFGVLIDRIKEAAQDEEFEGPRIMQMDFETGAINAFKEVFPLSELKGGHFVTRLQLFKFVCFC